MPSLISPPASPARSAVRITEPADEAREPSSKRVKFADEERKEPPSLSPPALPTSPISSFMVSAAQWPASDSDSDSVNVNLRVDDSGYVCLFITNRLFPAQSSTLVAECGMTVSDAEEKAEFETETEVLRTLLPPPLLSELVSDSLSHEQDEATDNTVADAVTDNGMVDDHSAMQPMSEVGGAAPVVEQSQPMPEPVPDAAMSDAVNEVRQEEVVCLKDLALATAVAEIEEIAIDSAAEMEAAPSASQSAQSETQPPVSESATAAEHADDSIAIMEDEQRHQAVPQPAVEPSSALAEISASYVDAVHAPVNEANSESISPSTPEPTAASEPVRPVPAAEEDAAIELAEQPLKITVEPPSQSQPLTSPQSEVDTHTESAMPDAAMDVSVLLITNESKRSAVTVTETVTEVESETGSAEIIASLKDTAQPADEVMIERGEEASVEEAVSLNICLLPSHEEQLSFADEQGQQSQPQLLLQPAIEEDSIASAPRDEPVPEPKDHEQQSSMRLEEKHEKVFSEKPVDELLAVGEIPAVVSQPPPQSEIEPHPVPVSTSEPNCETEIAVTIAMEEEEEQQHADIQSSLLTAHYRPSTPILQDEQILSAVHPTMSEMSLPVLSEQTLDTLEEMGSSHSYRTARHSLSRIESVVASLLSNGEGDNDDTLSDADTEANEEVSQRCQSISVIEENHRRELQLSISLVNMTSVRALETPLVRVAPSTPPPSASSEFVNSAHAALTAALEAPYPTSLGITRRITVIPGSEMHDDEDDHQQQPTVEEPQETEIEKLAAPVENECEPESEAPAKHAEAEDSDTEEDVERPSSPTFSDADFASQPQPMQTDDEDDESDAESALLTQQSHVSINDNDIDEAFTLENDGESPQQVHRSVSIDSAVSEDHSVTETNTAAHATEVALLHTRIVELQSQLTAQYKDTQRLEIDLRASDEVRSLLQSENSELTESNTQLQQSLMRCQNEIKRLETKLLQQANDHSKRLALVSDETDRLRQDADCAKSQLTAMGDTVKRQDEERIQLLSQCEHWKTELANEKHRSSLELSSQVQQFNAAMELKEQEIQAISSSPLHQKIELLQSQLAVLTGEKEAREQAVSEAESKAKSGRRELKELRKQHEKDKEKWASDYAINQKSVQELALKASELRGQLLVFEKDRVTYTEKIKSLEDKNSELVKSEKDFVRIQILQSLQQKDLERMEKEKAELTTSNKQAVADKEKLYERLREATESNNKSRGDLQAQITDLTGKYSSMSEKYSHVNEKYLSLKAQIESLTKEKQKLQSEHDKSQHSITQMRDVGRQLESEKAVWQMRETQLLSDVQDREERIAELIEKNKSLKETQKVLMSQQQSQAQQQPVIVMPHSLQTPQQQRMLTHETPFTPVPSLAVDRSVCELSPVPQSITTTRRPSKLSTSIKESTVKADTDWGAVSAKKAEKKSRDTMVFNKRADGESAMAKDEPPSLSPVITRQTSKAKANTVSIDSPPSKPSIPQAANTGAWELKKAKKPSNDRGEVVSMSDIACAESENQPQNRSLTPASGRTSGVKRTRSTINADPPAPVVVPVTTPVKPVILMTGFLEREELVAKIAMLGGELEDADESSDRTTHCLMKDISATTKSLTAASKGCWMVGSDWLEASIKAGKFLPEQDFASSLQYAANKFLGQSLTVDPELETSAKDINKIKLVKTVFRAGGGRLTLCDVSQGTNVADFIIVKDSHTKTRWHGSSKAKTIDEFLRLLEFYQLVQREKKKLKKTANNETAHQQQPSGSHDAATTPAVTVTDLTGDEPIMTAVKPANGKSDKKGKISVPVAAGEESSRPKLSQESASSNESRRTLRKRNDKSADEHFPDFELALEISKQQQSARVTEEIALAASRTVAEAAPVDEAKTSDMKESKESNAEPKRSAKKQKLLTVTPPPPSAHSDEFGMDTEVEELPMPCTVSAGAKRGRKSKATPMKKGRKLQ